MRKMDPVGKSVLLLFISLLVFFVPPLQAEEKPVSVDKPNANEMTVCVIRETAFAAGARGVWVGCNEKTVAALRSGNYCNFKVKTGPNIINIVFQKAPVAFYLLSFQPGETVYLVYKITKGTITRVTKEEGEGYITSYKNEPYLEQANPNDAYEFSLINPGFFNIELMKPTEGQVIPDSENAVVTMIRSGEFIGKAPFGVWSEDGYLGSLKGSTYIQCKMKPGKHVFVGKSQDFSVVEADVEAGKQYYIEFKARMGWFFANIVMTPVKKDTSNEILKEWINTSTNITYEKKFVTPDLQVVMDKAKIIIDEVRKKSAKGEIETTKLLPGDAR